MSARRSVLVVVLLPLCSLTLFFLYYHRHSIIANNSSNTGDLNPTIRIVQEYRRKQEALWAKGHESLQLPSANTLHLNNPTDNLTVSRNYKSKLDESTNTLDAKLVSPLRTDSKSDVSTRNELIPKDDVPLKKDSPPAVKETVPTKKKEATPTVVSRTPVKQEKTEPVTPEASSTSTRPYDYPAFRIPLPNSKNVSCYHDFSGITITEHNVFLYNSLCKIPSDLEIINFRGRRTYTDMGLDFTNPHIVLHGKNPVKRWADLAAMMKEKHSEKPQNKAVHVHNEIKIGDFFHFILKEHVAKNNAIKGVPKIGLKKDVLELTEQQMHQAMDVGQPPMVMSNAIDENWGFLSSCIGNKTTCWINMTNHLLIHNSNYDTVKHFLSSDKVTLVLCNSHVDPLIGTHPKVIGLPLGLRARTHVMNRGMTFLGVEFKKTKLLVINNSGWGDRKRVNEMVSAAFSYTVKNTYNSKSRGGSERMRQWRGNLTVQVGTDYYSDMIQAKFVLCPSGLGMDTYRLWEIILLGSIPVVESNAGFDRTYANLPVLVVRDYRELTPELLHRAYPCFVKHAAQFRYEHLTLAYWREMVVKAIVTGSIEHITEAHPTRNKYCDFLPQ